MSCLGGVDTPDHRDWPPARRPARGPVEGPRALRPSRRSAGRQSLAGKRWAPGAMSGRPHRRHGAAAGIYCMCQRMRQPRRADMRSILLRTFLMVAMGSTSFRRPRPSPVGAVGGSFRVTAARGPCGACGSAVSWSVVARPVVWPGSRSGLPAGRLGPGHAGDPARTSLGPIGPIEVVLPHLALAEVDGAEGG